MPKAKSGSFQVFEVICVILGFLALAMGTLILNQPNAQALGAGAIGAGCFWLILARICQAADHQAQIVALLSWRPGTDERPPVP
jgi:hypothetical protein